MRNEKPGTRNSEPRTQRPMLLRPSNLPKLAQCALYQPAPASTPALVRGSDLDDSFRSLLSGTETTWNVDADSDDVAAVHWAVDTARAFAGGEPIEAREEHLRVSV